MDLREHWNNKYSTSPESELGWYEASSDAILDLIPRDDIDPDDQIFIAGAGSSIIVDELFEAGFEHIIANDLSQFALDRLIERNKGKDLQANSNSLTVEGSIILDGKIKLWIDRAVLHFFHSAEEIEAYRKNLMANTSEDSYILLAEFAENGAEVCNALPVKRYSLEMMKDFLGDEFELLKHFTYEYINPRGGSRPYNYALFKRVL